MFENCIFDIKTTSPRGQSMSCCLWAFCPLSEVPGRSCMVDDIEGILPKGLYLACVSMAGRALLAGYHWYSWSYIALCCGTDSTYLCEPGLYWFQLMIWTNTVNSHEPHIISSSTVFQHLVQTNSKENIKALHYCHFMWEIHQWPVNSPHKASVIQKVFLFHEVIMQGWNEGSQVGNMLHTGACSTNIDWL